MVRPGIFAGLALVFPCPWYMVAVGGLLPLPVILVFGLSGVVQLAFSLGHGVLYTWLFWRWARRLDAIVRGGRLHPALAGALLLGGFVLLTFAPIYGSGENLLAGNKLKHNAYEIYRDTLVDVSGRGRRYPTGGPPQPPADAQRSGRSPDACVATVDRVAHSMSAEVKAGELFERRADRFVLRLTPVRIANAPFPIGWSVGVFEPDRDEDLSRFTPPLRGPNWRDLYAWHFRNADNTGPNDGSVNAPGTYREFIFSPEVGRTISYEGDATKMLANVARIEAFGQGTLSILAYTLTDPDRGKTPGFLWLSFTACLTWPR